MELFGIYSPNARGLNLSVPHVLLPEAYTGDAANMILEDGYVRRAAMPRKTMLDGSNDASATPDENPVLHYAWFEYSGTGCLLAFTKRHVYRWNATTKTWGNPIWYVCTPADGAAATATRWSTCQMNEKLFACNDTTDRVAVYNGSRMDVLESAAAYTGTTDTVSIPKGSTEVTGGGTGTTFTNHTVGQRMYIDGSSVGYPIDTITGNDTIHLAYPFAEDTVTDGTYIVYDKNGVDVDTGGTSAYIETAEHCIAFENYLVLANVTVDSTDYPLRFYWSALGDESEFDSGDAGYADVPGTEEISALATAGPFLILFTPHAMHRVWATFDEWVFNQAVVLHALGCQAPGSIVNGEVGELYFFASDHTFRAYAPGASEVPVISKPIESLARGITNPEQISGAWIGRYRQAAWACRTGGTPDSGDDDDNDTLLCVTDGVWTTLDLELTALGLYEQTSAPTWASYGANGGPSGAGTRWCDATEAWNAIDLSDEYRMPIAGDPDGYTVRLYTDEFVAGDTYTGYIVLATDLSQASSMHLKKRILYLDLWLGREPASGTGNNPTLDVWVRVDGQDRQVSDTVSRVVSDGEGFRPIAASDISHTAISDSDITARVQDSIDLYDHDGDDTANNDIFRVRVACSVVGRTFEIKLSALNRFRFVGLVAGYVVLGER